MYYLTNWSGMAAKVIKINIRKLGRERKVKYHKSMVRGWGKKYMRYEAY